MTVRSMLRGARRLFSRYTPLVTVGISKKNLLANLHAYQDQYPDLDFAPVLKSNAYGHGIVTVATLLDRQDIAFMMVDSYFEARQLRQEGIRSRILVMGYVRPSDIAASRLKNVDFAIVDIAQLKELAVLVHRMVRIHLKIDTGMHRQGIPFSELSHAEDVVKGQPLLAVVGICSHFADADNHDETFSERQLAVWKAASSELLYAFPTIEYRHIAATKGARFAAEAGTNVARLGIGLYGFDTAPGGRPLAPVMELRSIIASVRTLQKGESVGYNAAYTADGPMTIASVPLGYYEGIDRRLSNRGVMLVEGVECPIVGRVSMNICSIDVSRVPNVAPGMEVVAISRDAAARNSIPSIRRDVSDPEYRETEYVLLVHIASQLMRVVE